MTRLLNWLDSKNGQFWLAVLWGFNILTYGKLGSGEEILPFWVNVACFVMAVFFYLTKKAES